MSEEIQNKLQQEMEKFRSVCEEYQKALQQRHQLNAQLNENTAVKQELDLLKSDADIHKVIGTTFSKQDLEDAKQNVAKRMDFIRNELKRIDDFIATLDKKQDSHRDALYQLEQQFAQIQLKPS